MISIEVKGLSVSYEKKRVLTNIFLKVESGNVYGVVGPNGAGKSTLFKSILGLIDINSGDIDVLGNDISEVRKRVAYVPQKDDVDWSFPATVMDVVMQGRYPHKKLFQRLDAKDKAIAMQALDDIGIVDLADRQIGQLSGGQQQRVAVARALAPKPTFILADEPTANLDSASTANLLDMMLEMNQKENVTFVFSTHDQRVIDRARRIVTLEDGVIISDKTK